MLIGSALLLCILSVPLLGGRLGALAELEFRRGALAVAALFIQIVIISVLPGDAWGLSEEIHLATYFMLGAFLVANRHIPGLLVIALGGALNFAAIAANGGVMPADPDAIEAAGSRSTPATSSTPRPRATRRWASSATSSTRPRGCPSTTSSASATSRSCSAPSCSCTSSAARGSSTCPCVCVPRRHEAVRAFGSALSARGAKRFFFAHAQSSLGSGIAIVGLPLLAYDHYHTPWALTAVLLCELLPAVALGPLLGALADRMSRRTALVAADVLRLGAFGALALVPSLGLMIACALVAGIGSALFNPSALASVSRLSSPERPPGRDEPVLARSTTSA